MTSEDPAICVPGSHVAFVRSTDEHTRLREGDTGVVVSIDDLGTFHVAWDPDGHIFGLIPGVDIWRPLHPRWDGNNSPTFETKLCPHCQQQRPIGDFARRRKEGKVRQSWCRSCIADTNRERRKESQ